MNYKNTSILLPSILLIDSCSNENNNSDIPFKAKNTVNRNADTHILLSTKIVYDELIFLSWKSG